MGYSTEFRGQIEVSPPLSKKEREYLLAFNRTRHCRKDGSPYAVDPPSKKKAQLIGIPYESPEEMDHNRAASGQPGLWCHWIPNQDGTAIVWDGGEKFYDSLEWMQYLIDHFIGPNPIARKELKFIQPHTLKGIILAQGDNMLDRWELVVENGKARRRRA